MGNEVEPEPILMKVCQHCRLYADRHAHLHHDLTYQLTQYKSGVWHLYHRSLARGSCCGLAHRHVNIPTHVSPVPEAVNPAAWLASLADAAHADI